MVNDSRVKDWKGDAEDRKGKRGRLVRGVGEGDARGRERKGAGGLLRCRSETPDIVQDFLAITGGGRRESLGDKLQRLRRRGNARKRLMQIRVTSGSGT